MDNVLFQEILKNFDQSQATMDQHQTSAKTRFDTLENQQSSLGTRFDSLEDQQSEFGASIDEVTTTVSRIRNEQATLGQINKELLHRINKLEESSNTSITLRSPVRPKTDDSSQNSTTEDSPQSMVTDDPPTNNGWDNQDEILEFLEEENMDEIKTPPRISASLSNDKTTDNIIFEVLPLPPITLHQSSASKSSNQESYSSSSRPSRQMVLLNTYWKRCQGVSDIQHIPMRQCSHEERRP
jgi:hypothetical protein